MMINIQNLPPSNTTSANNQTNGTTTSGGAGNLPKLQVGQILPIQVLAIKGSQVQFSFGNQPQTYIANTPQNLTLKPQDQPQVEVKSTFPNLLLQIIPSASKATNNEALINQLLKQLLPNQQQSAKLLTHLIFDSKQLSPSIQAQITQLLDSLLKPNANLTAKDLKQKILTSGLFFENHLKKNASPELIKSDFKAKLLQLQATLQNSPDADKLSNTISKLLDKVSLQQIQAIQQGQIAIDMALHPNQLIEQIQIDIRKKTTKGKNLWEVYLSLELTNNQQPAQLDAKITLNDELFSITLWTENKELSKQLSEKLPKLQTAFKEAGLGLKQILMSQTPIQSSQDFQKISLIDIRV